MWVAEWARQRSLQKRCQKLDERLAEYDPPTVEIHHASRSLEYVVSNAKQCDKLLEAIGDDADLSYKTDNCRCVVVLRHRPISNLMDYIVMTLGFAGVLAVVWQFF